MLAKPTYVEGYCASLGQVGEAILKVTGGRGVALAVSSVTFHHLPSLRMRQCVLAFIARSLGEHVSHANPQPRTSRQGPRQVPGRSQAGLLLTRASLPWTGP